VPACAGRTFTPAAKRQIDAGGNSYVYFAQRLLFKWLNRRSQKRSLNWKQFSAYLLRWLPKARILHDLYPVPWWKTQAGSRMV
jgi:RNA-directed DNA polymerase